MAGSVPTSGTQPVAVPQHPAPSTQARCPAPQPAGGGRHHPAPPPLRLPLSPAHPGACPRFPAGPRRVPCPNACSDDRGCPPEQKCCFTGCGLGCVTPASPELGCHP
uniref:WAP domain-containing protein n=1 Tax=Anas platyrhynchos platyrhynchos TaxID=8840 RepID=A0A493TUH4_ANAPP